MKRKKALRVFVSVISAVVILALSALVARLKPFGIQEADCAMFWRCVVGTLFVLGLVVCLECNEKALRFFGFGFQVAAVVVAVVAINSVRTTLDLPGVFPTLGHSAARLFKSNSGAAVGEGALLEGSAGDTSAGIGTLTVHNKSLSTEDRFNALEDQLAKVEAMAGRDALLFTLALRDNKAAIATRDQANKALKDLVVQLLTGGLPLAFFGIVWVFIGAVLSSFPKTVEMWITRVHS